MANVVDIIVNAQDRASSTLKAIGGGFNGLSASAKKASGLIGAVLGVAGTALGAVAIAGAQANSELESSFAKWKTLTGSVEGANKQLAFIQQYAKNSPFDFVGVDQTATSLQAMGMELQDVNKWIPTLGDMASVLGGGTEQIQGVGMALGQMNAKGKVSAEEMGQLAERGVNAWGMLADGMGLSVAEVRKLSEDGKLLASDALPLIQKGMAETFGGGTQEYMKSTKGQFENLTEGAKQFAGQLTAPVYAWFGSTLLPMMNSALESLSTAFSMGSDGFAYLWKNSTGLAIALTVVAGVIAGALVGALYLLGGAITATIIPAITAFAPFLAIGLVIAGLAMLIASKWSFFAPFFNTVFSAVKNYVMGFKEAFMTSFQALQAGFTPLWNAIVELFNTIKPVLIAVGTVVGAVLGTMLTISLAVFNGVVRAIAPLITAFVKFGTMVANVVKAVVKLLSGDMKGASEAWKKATQNAVDVVKNLWNAFKGFFSGFVGTIVSIFSKFGVDLKSKATSMMNNLKSSFTNGMNNAKQAISNGISNIISAVKGWFSTFTSSGKGLLEAFTKGIKSGIGKAVDAVSSGMKKIRDFLPFSPAKKGALSDLDKSGESFFPTWYNGALKKVPAMTRAIGGALASANHELESGMGVPLQSFTGGRSRMNVTVTHEVSGTVDVSGDNGKTSFDVTAQRVQEQFNSGIDLGSLRQAIRKR